MQNTRQGLLPFHDLASDQFEAFVLSFLGAGISLEVIESKTGPEQQEARAAKYRIVGASLYGSSGRAGQRGADIVATTEMGAKWVFECKHYTSAFTVPKAEAVLRKASEGFPKASRFFLVMSGEPTPAVREKVEANPVWNIWGGSELSTRFFNEVERTKQIEILQRCFPRRASDLIEQLYPLRDDYLVPVEAFFEVWRRPKRLFHHSARMVNRVETLKALHEFVRNPERQALILPAAGGVGKTRLLLAFGESFAAEHPGKNLFFVDTAARPDVGSTRLRAAGDGELVVIQDDAQRAESLRSELVASLIEKQGKIILATRPHAVDALVGWLTQTGMDPSHIQTLPLLSGLSSPDRITLARQLLPPNHRDMAEKLASLAKDCALIVTVGAKLISDSQITPADYLDSDDFRRAVFDRLESESFVHAIPPTSVALARKILRLLAVLAPWNESVLSRTVIAELLECNPREFQEIFDQLRAAALLVETREGWRVVPDLFADDLVYRGCYEKDGRLTDFAHRLQDKLAPIAGGTVLRNLAEAEWQAQLNDSKNLESLLAPFWNRIRLQFCDSNFLERSEILKQWSRFAMLQPERSLELARLALDLREAPPPPAHYPANDFGQSLFRYERTVAEIPLLLEPVAIFHGNHRSAALDLLWETHRRLGQVDENDRSSALAAIGRVAKFRAGQSISAPQAVLSWLDSKLQGPQASEFCGDPSPVLSVILKPIFEHEVDDSRVEGRTISIRSLPISVENTAKVRDRALQILAERVVPMGENATLNAVNVLSAAVDHVRVRLRGNTPPDILTEWLPERRKALSILGALVTSQQSPRVLYRIRQLLKPLARYDQQPEFKADCTDLLRRIPDTPGLRLARVLLSNALGEFLDYSPEIDLPAAEKEAQSQWETLCNSSAQPLLERSPTAPELIGDLGQNLTEFSRAGMKPQAFELLAAVARLNPGLADQCIDELIANEKAAIDPWWTALFFSRHQFPDSKLEDWVKRVLEGENAARWRPLLSLFGWVGIGKIPLDVVNLIAHWAQRLRNDDIEYALNELRWRDQRRAEIYDAILCNLNLPIFSDSTMYQIGNVLELATEANENRLPTNFVLRFIAELGRVAQLDEASERGFIARLAKLQPKAFLEMLIRRIQTEKNRRALGQRFTALPHVSSLTLTGLDKVEDYARIASDIWRNYQASPANDESRYWWRKLFQNAVMQVSPLGVDFLRQWLREIGTLPELKELIEAMHFEGSMLVFTQPDFVREILNKAREIAPTEFEQVRWQIGYTASPKMRGYIDHQLEPEYRYYREEAAKAAIVHAQDPELSALYREIVRSEDADAARQRREGELDAVEW